MDLRAELRGLLAANVPLLNLVTYEEERVTRILSEAAAEAGLGVAAWDLADGFHVVRPGREAFPEKACTTETLLPHLAEKLPQAWVIVLKDFHHAWEQRRGYVTRKLRNMAPELRARNQFLVILTPEARVPVELKDDLLVLRVPLPGHEEMDQLFGEMTHQLNPAALPRPEVRERLVAAALGLTSTQARLAFARVWARHQRYDDRGVAEVTWAKREVIRESGALEFWPADEGEDDVGGLDRLKQWLRVREEAFSLEARHAKLPFPRGVVLIGIPGTGKSLTAKMLSGLWKLPLLRLDVGAVFGGVVGESEENIRKAVSLADTVSPCILWIDELEKAFAGAAASAVNAGVATRVFGTFLTWMQEHRTPVFVIATANDVAGLAPELMGRFDRTFFLDLPNEAERRAILQIHLKRAGVLFPERSLRMDDLVERSRGFVGREIERVVREAQFAAFADGNREVEQADVLASLSETMPLSRSHAEVITELRRWLTEGRAFPASAEEQRPAPARGRVIEAA